MTGRQLSISGKELYGSTTHAKIIVTVPPGRLGIRLIDNVNGKVSTIISKVDNDSPLVGILFEGDRLVDVNGVHVHQMSSSGKMKYECISSFFTSTYRRKINIICQLSSSCFDGNLGMRKPLLLFVKCRNE